MLEELGVTFHGRWIVEVIDLTRDTEAGARGRVSVILTRIVFAPDGRELYPHEGFMPGEDVLARWRELGFDLERPAVGCGGDHASVAAPGSFPRVALGRCFCPGVLNLVLSPCHSAGIPLIVGFISGQPRPALGRAFATAALFALGILVTLGGSAS
ncbi:hypothetical protein [Limisphaera sp. 4302-co]|uniref:hypothetical protein n=1 Tax=Limisphaera sp. 4302-co TaxID=3400417 RepID=UPI003C1E5C20